VQDGRDRRIGVLERDLADLKKVVQALVADNGRLHSENEAMRGEMAALRAENDELKRRLGQNSSNSSKPPSSDSPSDRDARPGKKPSGRRRGGQPGHKGVRRELLTPTSPPVDCYPALCRRCDKDLPRRRDPDPIRHQTVDVPRITAVVSEWRLHRVTCECGAVTCARLPDGVPQGMCAPGLMALIALLTGDYNLSRRRAVSLLNDVLGVDISLGALSGVEESVSEVLEAPCQEIRAHVAEQPVKHSDATNWSLAGKARTLWTIATACATAFFITEDASMPGLRGLFAKIKGILVSDRGRQFAFWAMDKRQICWAHLIRKFAAFGEQGGAVGRMGESLLLLSRTMIHCWHQVRDGTMPRAKFQRIVGNLIPLVEGHLQVGVDLGVRGVSGSCKDILDHRSAMWTFVREPGVEPTNNNAERALRAFVLWRKASFGSQSDRGCRFAERIMTVTHTLRKQKRHVLSYLTLACQAALRGEPVPSLLNTIP